MHLLKNNSQKHIVNYLKNIPITQNKKEKQLWNILKINY